MELLAQHLFVRTEQTYKLFAFYPCMVFSEINLQQPQIESSETHQQHLAARKLRSADVLSPATYI